MQYSVEPLWIDDDFQPRPLSRDERASVERDLAELETPPSWTLNEQEYQEHYEHLVSHNRLQSYRHFLRTIHRRPLSFTAQTLIRTAGRKAAALFERD
jgi:hypothetical protein